MSDHIGKVGIQLVARSGFSQHDRSSHALSAMIGFVVIGLCGILIDASNAAPLTLLVEAVRTSEPIRDPTAPMPDHEPATTPTPQTRWYAKAVSRNGGGL